MIDALAFKPDFEHTARRFAAWWHGELIDRPPVTLGVPPVRPVDGPAPPPTLRQRWLDVEFNVERAIARMAVTPCLGDSLPVYMPNIGPELASTLLGAELEFAEHTSWSIPRIHDVAHWRDVAGRALDFGNPYWQAVESMTRLALDRSAGRYLVGLPDLHGNLDILAGLREPQALCMDLLDDVDAVRVALDQAVAAYVAAFDRIWAILDAAGQPATTWIPFLHDGPAYVPSCDFWCLLGDELARDLALPAILREMAPLQRSVFHLDGPQALRHLDLLLDLPRLDAVQWVYGAGNGPATRWLEVYRRCLSRGKSVQVLAETAEDALTVLEALGPRGVWLDVQRPLATSDNARAFLREIERLTTGA